MSNPIDFTKPVQTVAGDAVEIITTKGRGQYPIVGYIGESKSPACWTAQGLKQFGQPHHLDLMNVPETSLEFEGYINVYEGIPMFGYDLHETRKAADLWCSVSDNKRIACIKVKFIEGRFDE